MSYLENVRSKQDVETALRTEENTMSVNRMRFDADRIHLLLMGDEHMGNHTYNEDLHMQVLEHAYDNGWYLIHMGDAIEAATRNSIGAGVYTQEQIIDSQMSDMIAKYNPFVEAGRMIGFHPGNHELRAMNDDGVNLTRQMCRTMKGKYLGIARPHLFRVGNQTYSLYSLHGSSGARMAHTKIKAAIDLERVIDVEIYAHAHLHQLSHHVRNYYKINKRNKQTEQHQKHFILTGSYLDYPNSYAQMKSMEPARMGSPIITLDGNEHQIKVALQ